MAAAAAAAEGVDEEWRARSSFRLMGTVMDLLVEWQVWPLQGER